jgi:hypothetical protein
MALTSSEDLLLATGKSTIQVIPSGQLELMDSLYNVSPLLPTAVHVTHDNKVIVGAVNKVPCFPVTGPRQVIIMDHTGCSYNASGAKQFVSMIYVWMSCIYIFDASFLIQYNNSPL